MNDHQSPTTKPLITSNLTHSDSSTRSSPALQGATSAFFPKPVAPTTGLPTTSTSPPSAGARYAALAAGARSYQALSVASTPARYAVQRDVSPERGRRAQPVRPLLTRAATSATTLNIKPVVTKHANLDRSPSMIAARFASSQSTSPRRSPESSPKRGARYGVIHTSPEPFDPEMANALSGALASIASPQIEETSSPPGVREKVLNFDQIPRLSATSKYNRTPSARNDYIGNTDMGNAKESGIADTDVRTSLHDRTYGFRNMASSPHSANRSSGLSKSRIPAEHDNIHQQATTSRRPPIPTRRSPKGQQYRPPISKTSSSEEQRMMVNSLADAMVASSLASSRAASPAKRPTPLAARRRSRSFSALQDLMAKYDIDDSAKHVKPLKSSRPLKPQRPMKQTLRKPSASDDDEEPELVKRGRRHWMRKHPNMHHEGNRKRWRDTITEPERRRYEGVFAANRGLHIGPGYFEPSPSALSDLTAEGNKVANVVVRDLWDRSRLPREILQEIYDLVSPEEEQSLGRDQFVVGMWLVDQRLKGRKLPVKVSSTVWASARHATSLKMKHKGR